MDSLEIICMKRHLEFDRPDEHSADDSEDITEKGDQRHHADHGNQFRDHKESPGRKTHGYHGIDLFG